MSTIPSTKGKSSSWREGEGEEDEEGRGTHATFGQDWVDVEEGMKKEVRKRPKRERTEEEGRV